MASKKQISEWRKRSRKPAGVREAFEKKKKVQSGFKRSGSVTGKGLPTTLEDVQQQTIRALADLDDVLDTISLIVSQLH